jgi:two-component system response regulator VicR
MLAERGTMQDERILVVDDHHDNVAIIRDFLLARGYDVAVAHSGEEALARFEETGPSLVLLDVMMPDRNGWEVCEAIKQRSRGANDVRVIMVTALGEWDDKREALRTGADDYVTKPLDLIDLGERVERNLAIVRAGR